MAQVGVELKTLVSEPDSLTTRPPSRAGCNRSEQRANIGRYEAT